MDLLETPQNAQIVIPLFELSTTCENQITVEFCPKIAKNGLFPVLYTFSGREHTCNVAGFFPLAWCQLPVKTDFQKCNFPNIPKIPYKAIFCEKTFFTHWEFLMTAVFVFNFFWEFSQQVLIFLSRETNFNFNEGTSSQPVHSAVEIYFQAGARLFQKRNCRLSQLLMT